MGRNVIFLAVFSIFLCSLSLHEASADSWRHRDSQDRDSWDRDSRNRDSWDRDSRDRDSRDRSPWDRAPRNENLRNGTVIQVTGEPELYYVVNGYAAHIPTMKVFECMNLGRHRKIQVSRQQLDSMPKTAFLIRGNDEKVYRIDGEFRRHVPNLQVFRRLGFNDDEVISVDDGALRCIPNGPALR